MEQCFKCHKQSQAETGANDISTLAETSWNTEHYKQVSVSPNSFYIENVTAVLEPI